MRVVVAALLLGLVVTAPAEAQFGGIGKRVRNAAASAAGAPAGDGELRAWTGMRYVPVGLVARVR